MPSSSKRTVVQGNVLVVTQWDELQLILRAIGSRIELLKMDFVADPKEALDALRSRPVDVVVCSLSPRDDLDCARMFLESFLAMPDTDRHKLILIGGDALERAAPTLCSRAKRRAFRILGVFTLAEFEDVLVRATQRAL